MHHQLEPCCSRRGSLARQLIHSRRSWASTRRLSGHLRRDRPAVDDVLPQSAGRAAGAAKPRVANRKLRGALPEVCDVIVTEAYSFDAADLTHAFGRLAKAYRACASKLHRGPATLGLRQVHAECVLPAVQHLSRQLPRLISDLEAWNVAQVLWAMSVLNWYDRTVFDALCQRGSLVAASMQPADCAMVMLAFGRFGHYHPELLKHVPQVMLKELEHAKAVEVSSTLWGFAKLGIPLAPGKVFMEAISDHLMWTMDQYGCQELVNSLWATASLGHYPGKQLLRAAERKLLERVQLMNPQDISNALWAFGRMRYKAVDLLDELPLHIGRRLNEFKPQELSCVLYGYTQARHYHSGLLDAAAPVLMLRASQLSSQDLVIALWAYGVFGHKPSLSGPAMAAALSSPSSAAAAGAAATALGHLAASNEQASGSSGGSGSSGDSGDSSRATGSQSASSSTRQSLPEAAHLAPADHRPASGVASPAAEPSAVSSGPPPSSNAGLHLFVDALVVVAQRRLRYLRPTALSNVVKALASLGVDRPQVQALAREAARLAEARVHEFRPDEMSNLLYGLSLMNFNDLQVYYACVRQLLRTMEDPGSAYADTRCLNHKVFNSIIHSCVSAGYTPWTLIECGEARGVRLRGRPGSLAPRQVGHAPLSVSRARQRARGAGSLRQGQVPVSGGVTEQGPTAAPGVNGSECVLTPGPSVASGELSMQEAKRQAGQGRNGHAQTSLSEAWGHL